MEPNLIVILLGNSGVGKSATGTTILGRQAFESKRSFKPVTTQISTNTQTVLGKQICVIDTPGIFGSERELETLCHEHLESSTPCLILVVVKIDRFTIEERKVVEAIKKVVGNERFDRCYLLFTGGDSLDHTMVEDLISEEPVLKSFGERWHVFNNVAGGQDQVKELLEKSGHLTKVLASGPTLAPVRIVLLGLPGDGKSTSGNTILGSDQFRSASGFDTVSTKTEAKSAVVEGRQVTVVDTPGISGNVLSPRKLFEEIVNAIIVAEPGPHALIVVVRIGRIKDAEIKLFDLLHKLFGGDVFKYTMVLFTHGDVLNSQPISKMIQNNDDVKELVSKCSGRYSVFNNLQGSNKEQVRNLMGNIDRMFRVNAGQPCTSDEFQKVQKLTLKLQIWCKEFHQWFTKWLQNIDSCRAGYSHVV